MLTTDHNRAVKVSALARSLSRRSVPRFT